MKKTVFVVTFLFLSMVAICQATTQLEYNYIKKGLPKSLDEGMDVKSGYTLVELPKEGFKGDRFSITISALKRTRDNTTAGFSIKIYKAEGNFTSALNQFLCMPAANSMTQESFGWGDFFADLGGLPGDIKDILLKLWAYKAALSLMDAK